MKIIIINCGTIIFREMKISRFDLFRANHNRPDVALNLANGSFKQKKIGASRKDQIMNTAFRFFLKTAPGILGRVCIFELHFA